MLFTPANDYAAVLDACVLVPMALCDTLLRLAETPAMYRPFWSEQILAEVARTLQLEFRKSAEQVSWRLSQMRRAFPEAMVAAPHELVNILDCIPDADDRHVLAAAIVAQADAIITQNEKDSPADCLARFGILRRTPDEFLLDQYQLAPQAILDKLDDQAAAISQERAFVIENLQPCAPGFCKLLKAR